MSHISTMATATAVTPTSRIHFPSNQFSPLDSAHPQAGPSTSMSPARDGQRRATGPASKSSKSSLSTAGQSTPKVVPRDPLPSTHGVSEDSSVARIAMPSRTPNKPASNGKLRNPKRSAADRSPTKASQALPGYHSLAQASLSTPELHLSSDPLMDAYDAEHRLLIFPQKDKPVAASPPATKSRPFALGKGDYNRTRSSDALPLSGEGPYSSLGAVLGAVQDSQNNLSTDNVLLARPSNGGQSLDLHDSGTIIMRDFTVEPSPKSPQAVLPPASSLSRQDTVVSKKHNSASSNWFKRARKWSAASRSKDAAGSSADRSATSNKSTYLPASASTSSTNEPPRLSMSSSLYSSGSEPSTVEDGSMFFSDSAFNSSATQATEPTETSIASIDPDSASLERLRSARTYMVEELSKLSHREMGVDRDRVASLAWFVREKEAESRGIEIESSREMLEFWNSISSGVLLCLLVNRLKPGAVDRIDRRDIEWVKADNLSRFLRAARDFFGVRSKDLFHPLDLADATVEGLDRAVCTILAMQRSAKTQGMSVRSPSSPVNAEALERVHSKRRSLIASPPRTPESATFELAPDPYHGHDSPHGSPSRRGSCGSKKGRSMTIQQHRQAAEDKLVRAVSPTPLTTEAHIRARRRRSSDAGGHLLPGTRAKAPSITFAEASFNVRSPSDDDSRMPYRDRKMSESAVSLTGVVEEEVEELANGGAVAPTDSDPSLSVPSSPSLTGLGRPRGSSPLARSSSQRRISQEIGLGQSPRAFRGSFDGSDDVRIPGISSGSPVRQSPARRHSARAGNGLSALNPSREFTSNHGDVPTTPRVPFPRSPSTGDSAQFKRSSIAFSTIDSDSGSGTSGSPFIGYALSNGSGSAIPASPGFPSRPSFRHMRYTSELHLPVTQRSGSDEGKSPISPASVTAQPIPIRPRTRVDSDVGSLYSSSANAMHSTDDLESIPRQGRDKAAQATTSSRHKLVLTEGGKNVTYQMGNCIGRGQFGSVYRALNLNSGQMVAVKRIKLEGRSEEEVTQLMNEVDLLKSLAHPSVVKYEGLVRGKDVISIILEYVENGSLLHTLKAFGEFPEKLVASYVVKILEGLNYLHDSKVVHCDLKAANILTTKNGNVKLSDFGVSLNLQAMERVQKNDAVGTPNWMAPEVIELKGASTAADIWSLGCTIIELLTGKPPYGDMLAMSAMFRIVEDDRPPIPDKCSDSLRDFLIQCFHKDPTKRPTAESLFEHEWLRKTWTGHKELRPQDSVPFLRRISLDSRRFDVRALHAAVNEVAEPTEVRGANRPTYGDMRAFSDPSGEAWSSTEGGAEKAIAPVLLSSSPLDATGSLSPSATASDMKVQASGSSWPPGGTSSQDGAVVPSLDPSMLDLTATEGASSANATPDEEINKPHSFVKSTFSKAVRCRICSENVRKHAVLCEDCGLICHASCARDVAGPCNLRAQMLMLTQKTSQTSPREEGPPAATPSGLFESSGIASPGLLPVSFKFPFSKAKRNSKSSFERVPTLELQHEDGNATEGERTGESAAVDSFKVDGAVKDGSTERGGRYRRISLLAVSRLKGKSAQPSPGFSSPEVHAGTASNEFTTARVNGRRGSSISYGSMSGSSSVSSASHVAAAMEQTGSTGTAAGRQQQTQTAKPNRHRVSQSVSLAAISTPHLNKARAPPAFADKRHSSNQHSGVDMAPAHRDAQDSAQRRLAERRSFSHDSVPQRDADASEAKRRARRTSMTTKKAKEECAVM